MKKAAVVIACLMATAITACAAANSDAALAVYLPRSHSHNNYAQRRPLFSALERGFASVEVDVIVVDGELFVGHDLKDVRQSATLSRMYLDPLREIIRRNGGSAYAQSERPLQLLIDVKTEANETYRALHRTLEGYSDLLTTWTEAGVRPGPISVVLSGNRALELLAAQSVRYVAIDGRVTDDRSTWSVDLMPLVSADWEELGTSTAERSTNAQALVERLHAEGRTVRFWGTPERSDLWGSLLSMGVDYIGTDEVGRLDGWLRRVGD